MRLGVKLKPLSHELNCRQLSLNAKKAALLQDELFHTYYSRVFGDRFADLKMAVCVLLTDIILILIRIRFR